jgi:cytochrome c oxidase subunit 2
MREGRRDVIRVAIIWIVVTAAVELWAAGANLQPLGASREAEIVDGAFHLLLVLAIPVVTFVLVMLGYSMARFREAPDGSDASPLRTNRRFVSSWLGISAALSVLVIITPGFTGLDELRAEPTQDLTIEVTAEQWNWSFHYVEDDVTVEKADELVLPVDHRIRFLVTSSDVVHSFWIPGFRIKIDAVPGKVSEVLTTPTMVGDLGLDPNFRVQCAELCGTGHARMRAEVRVVDESEFSAWMADRRENSQ